MKYNDTINIITTLLSEQEIKNANENTELIGHTSELDSLGLVVLLSGIEQYLLDTYNISITIADERAMSQRNSPFKSVKSLAEYIVKIT